MARLMSGSRRVRSGAGWRRSDGPHPLEQGGGVRVFHTWTGRRGDGPDALVGPPGLDVRVVIQDLVPYGARGFEVTSFHLTLPPHWYSKSEDFGVMALVAAISPWPMRRVIPVVIASIRPAASCPHGGDPPRTGLRRPRQQQPVPARLSDRAERPAGRRAAVLRRLPLRRGPSSVRADRFAVRDDGDTPGPAPRPGTHRGAGRRGHAERPPRAGTWAGRGAGGTGGRVTPCRSASRCSRTRRRSRCTGRPGSGPECPRRSSS